MSTKAADQYDNIAKRLKEIEAEKLARLSAPEPAEQKPEPIDYGAAYEYGGFCG